MNEADSEKIENLKGEIADAEDSSIADIPFELLEKQGNRTTKLVATSGEVSPIDGRRRWHDFKFREPVLVARVTVQTSGYKDFSEFEFTWQTETGKEKRSQENPKNGIVTFSVNDICKAISFRPPTAFFSHTQIQLVRIEGIKREDVPGALDNLSRLEDLKQEILSVADRAIARADARIAEGEKAEAEKVVVQREIATLKQSASRHKKSVEDLSLKKNELIAENGEASRALELAQDTAANLRGEIAAMRTENSNLSKEISEKEKTLKELKNNINLFPTEIVEFVNQGSKNIRLYFWLAAAPIAIIVILFVMLVNGAANLTTVITTNKDINIQALMLSRLPYVTIATAIIAACYKIARAFFSEMIRINSQRLNLTKVSIIAKDVSSAAEYGLNLSDDDIYRLRTELKMSLLKDHLKDYISKDFKIELPKRILGITLRDEGEPGEQGNLP